MNRVCKQSKNLCPGNSSMLFVQPISSYKESYFFPFFCDILNPQDLVKVPTFSEKSLQTILALRLVSLMVQLFFLNKFGNRNFTKCCGSTVSQKTNLQKSKIRFVVIRGGALGRRNQMKAAKIYKISIIKQILGMLCKHVSIILLYAIYQS